MARANRTDCLLSEQVVYLAGFAWKNERAEVPIIKGISKDDIRRVCQEFDSVSAVWSKLEIGESMTLVWRAETTQGEKRRLLKLR